jgi:hypothetical protein
MGRPRIPFPEIRNGGKAQQIAVFGTIDGGEFLIRKWK